MSACMPECSKTKGHAPGCAYVPEEDFERQALELLDERSRIFQASRVQNVDKAYHQATHWDSARTSLIAQGHPPARALQMLGDPRLKVCSSGCVHHADSPGKKSGYLPPGTKPKVRKWGLKP